MLTHKHIKHTMEYYSVIKNNAICSYMDGPRSYQVQNMILSEGIQKEKE